MFHRMSAFSLMGCFFYARAGYSSNHFSTKGSGLGVQFSFQFQISYPTPQQAKQGEIVQLDFLGAISISIYYITWILRESEAFIGKIQI